MTLRAVVRSLFVSLLLFTAAGAFAASAWTPIGPPGGAAYGLSIDPKDANVLYAGTYSGGVWKSKDGGANWTRLTAQVDETMNAVAVSPADSRVVLAAGHAGLYRSADAGATWKTVLDQKQQQPAMTGFAFDPTKPTTVYVSSDSDGFPAGVFKSTDSGATWKAANGGIHTNSRVWGVAVARDASSLWASSSDGVYQSTDAGGTWTNVLAGKIAHSVATGADGLVLVGTNVDGILRSTDGKNFAETKIDVKMSGKIVYAILGSTATPNLFYAAIPNRVLRSTDNGRTWTTFSRGFDWINFRSLALDEKSGTVWAGSGRDGVVKSADKGATWTTGAGMLSLQVTSLLVDPSSAKRIFAGTTQGGVHRSEDGGVTWELANEGVDDRSVYSFAAHPSSPGTFLMGTDEGAYRSTDSGTTWTHVKGGCDPVVQNLQFTSTKRVWAHSGRDFCQVIRSDDGGLTWQEVKTPRPDSSMRGYFAFYVDPKSPDHIMFNTYRSLHWSTDAGVTWTEATGIPSTSQIQSIVAGKVPESLFAATNLGIYRSADNGKTWTAAGTATARLNVRRVVVDANSGTIWAGAWSDGILRSTDDGKTWSRIGGEPPHPDLVALTMESPKSLLVGFDG
ncbi:MAG: hypothetical protein JJE51_13275, partial [Thermoanaerobaculia bacterium]|nr:hypothetical protein [Thermoanaerobaculia bacterium]